MNFKKFFIFTFFSVIYLSCSSPAKSKLNILMIIVDDMRPDISAWGKENIKTPNIDHLVNQGISFKRAYAQYANCSPSRMSFLTGISPHRLGHEGRLSDKKQFETHTTLPGHFKDNGYYTASFGKVYHSINDDKSSWDYIYDVKLNDSHEIPWESFASEINQQLKGHNRPAIESTKEPIESYNDTKISIDVMDQLEKNKDNPFFMAVGFRKPHLPFAAPQKYWDMYKRENIKVSKFADAPINGDSIVYQWSELASYNKYSESYFSNNYRNSKINSQDAQELRHGYFACISYIDDLVGMLIKKLEDLELSNNTIIIFMSDHGYHLGEQQIWGKHSSYELSTNIPLVIYDPTQKNKGMECLNFIELIDIYPTLTELSEIKSPANVDGQSFYDFFNNPEKVSQKSAYSQYQTFQKNRTFSNYMAYAIYTKDFNYIEWQDIHNDRDVVQTELYVMSDSRIENINVNNEPKFSEIKKELSLKIWENFEF